MEGQLLIGQSGKMISTSCYMGGGLSGELQRLAVNMVDSRGAYIIIDINSDSKSPVFERVNYGVVAACKGFTPLPIEKIEELIGQQPVQREIIVVRETMTC